jgi:hypothetical protein
LVSGVALGAILGAGQPGQALTINPLFDAAFPLEAQNVVRDVVTEFQNTFSNPVTLNIAFGWGQTFPGEPVISGAAAQFPGPNFQDNQFSLTATKGFYATAIGLQPNNAALATAFANLPATYPNPGRASTFFIPDTLYKALNGVAFNADRIDAATGYATSFCGPGGTCPYDFSGGKPPANAIDFKAVVEHELSHAMGRVDYAWASKMPNGAPDFLMPLDFFKYDCNTRTLDPRFNLTCFSIDGGATNPGGRTFSNVSDSPDWIGFLDDSNNAFLNQGIQATFSSFDITEMCALGYDCAVPEPATLLLWGTTMAGLGFANRWRRRRQG